MSLHYPTKTFEFNNLKLSSPNGLQGGSYFVKLLYKDDDLLIQTPKSLTKNGILTTGKKIYCDLMFSEENTELLEWLDNLEKRLQQLLYEKKDTWFQNDLELDDIEYLFTSVYRQYKTKYNLIRSFVKQNKNFKNTDNFTIYNEKEEPLTISDVNKDNKIITILEISGIKFSNNSIRVDIYLKQMMVFKNSPIFSNCIIKTNNLTNEENTKEPFHGNHLEETTETIIPIETTETTNPVETTETTETIIPIETTENIKYEIIEPLEKLDTQNTNKIISENTDSVITSLKDLEEKDTEEKDLEEKDTEEKDTEEKDTNTENNHINLVENNKYLEKNYNESLVEVNLNTNDIQDSISLKKPNEIYYELYQATILKARKARDYAIKTYLDAKKIKNTFLLDNVENLEEEETFLESFAEY